MATTVTNANGSGYMTASVTNANATNPLLCDDDVLRVPNNSSKDGKSTFYTEVLEELVSLWRIAGPATATGLLSYARNLVSMVFLGHLGHLELAAGALAIGFANITGYSIIFGLAMGMEPICGQAYGAKKWSLLGLAMHRTIAILLLASVPVSFLWLNVGAILNRLGQERAITELARIYLLCSLPDLVAQSVLHPLRIFLRAQNVTRPTAFCSAAASLLHVPLNYYLVVVLGTGIRGVAAAAAATNFSLVLLLSCYICSSGACRETWAAVSLDCFREWGPVLSLAVPSCVSVCLEWWWYELMIILCGVLEGPERTVSAVGILMQMTALVYVLPSSLGYGASTRVAQELGAGRGGGARRAAAVGTACGAGAGAAALAFNVWARRWWGRMFTSAAGVVELVAAALPVVGLCEVGNCPQTVMCGVLRGSARARLGARVNLGGFYAVGMPVALLCGFYVGLGFQGLWLGLLAAQLWCAAALAVVLARTDWGLQARRAEELTNSCSSSSSSSSVEEVEKGCVVV